MAELTDEQKLEIVEALARFEAPSAIIAHFQSEHGLQIDHKQVGRYDPQRSYHAGGEKWRTIFDARRKAYLLDVAAIPVAHKGYRLNMLQRGVEAAEKAGNWLLVAKLLQQAAEEVGGTLTNQRHTTIEEGRKLSAKDMTPEERQSALAEIIRKVQEDMRRDEGITTETMQ